MLVVPQVFYRDENILKLLTDGLSSIVIKRSYLQNSNPDRYLAVHGLSVILSGSLKITTYDGDIITVEKNQMVFLPKGLYMMSDLIPRNKYYEGLVFFFEDDIINEFLSNYPFTGKLVSSKKMPIQKFVFTEELQLFASSLKNLYQTELSRSYNRITRHKLFEFLYLIASSPQGSSFIEVLSSLQNQERRNIKIFMEQNFDKPLKIEDYAYLTGRSASKFHRDFKQQFGIGPKQWLIKNRLEKAYNLLQQGELLAVTQVALEVGYENTSHFIKAFQKEYGVSPKQLMMQMRKNILV